ncbi:MAG: hypothetical protein JSV15_02455 [Candidatus Bathyarchaeota archaeon]|nr:MAG: hypothetical protein JSV15_02455 [Candidatus Bathyarchaeota archaeon]
MPLRVICHGCGVVLYEGAELKPPYEIIEIFNGKCPTCCRKLSHIPTQVEIKPVNGAD